MDEQTEVYRIIVVGDDGWPEGQDWHVAKSPTGKVTAYIRRSAYGPELVARVHRVIYEEVLAA